MKKLVGLIALLAMVSLGIFGCSSGGPEEPATKKAQAAEIGVTTGKAAPSFRLKNLQGQEITIDGSRDQKIYVLNFWATWCPPCRAEMPDLEKFYQKKQGELQFYAINLDEPADKVQSFVNSNGLTFPVLLDQGGDVGALYKVNAIPTTLVLDKTGTVRLRKSGMITEAELENVLAKIRAGN